MNQSLKGKSALVTGAGTGIGKGIAIELARRGAKVAIHYNASEAGAKDTQHQIEEFGGLCMTLQADVANREQIFSMVDGAIAEFGGIDILVNNAALQLNKHWFEYTEELYDRVMDINLKGYWQCMQAVIPYMKKRNFGRIINISSVHGKDPPISTRSTACRKAALKCSAGKVRLSLHVMALRSIRLRPARLMSASPGNRIDIPIQKIPLGRVGLPADIASLACYIASDETSFMTGSTIRVDGAGMLM